LNDDPVEVFDAVLLAEYQRTNGNPAEAASRRGGAPQREFVAGARSPSNGKLSQSINY